MPSSASSLTDPTGILRTESLAFGPDRSVWEWSVANRTDAWTRTMKVVTTLGDTVTMTLVAVLATTTLLVLRRVRSAVLVGAGSLIGYGLMVGLKHLIGRERPPAEARLLDIDTFSMPSGHAMMATIVYGLIAVAGYHSSSWVRAHRLVLVAAPVLAVAIGWSRVYLGVHWMTDVVTGWLLGVVFVASATYVVFRTDRLGRRGSLAGSPTVAGTPQSSRTDRRPGPPGKW
ncbi:undecaprenyl-diphosphatase [Williamsia muralis]|nr:undecaprenyl-diphosphatase [Williamsia marianensis]